MILDKVKIVHGLTKAGPFSSPNMHLQFWEGHIRCDLLNKAGFCEIALACFLQCATSAIYTVKLGDKERFNKEQIGVKEPFPMTNLTIYFIRIRNIWR